jgi:uncharacterized repeat protein (TIGR01451 family)
MRIDKLVISYLLLNCTILFANTPDGLTPATEIICSGLSGDQFGICNSYCEAMDCDNPAHKASDKACQTHLRKWNSLMPNQPIPCESKPKISLVKDVNKDADGFILTGTPVKYTFTIMNVGDVPLKNITLTDNTIPSDALSHCRDSVLNGLVLAVNQTVQCETNDTPAILAPSDVKDSTVTNKAVVNGASIYGQPVQASAEVTYIGESYDIIPQCPCSAARLRLAFKTWDQIVVNGVSATPVEQNCDFVNVSQNLFNNTLTYFSKPFNEPALTAVRIVYGSVDGSEVNMCDISVVENGVVKYSTRVKATTHPVGNIVGPCRQLIDVTCASMQVPASN